MTNLGIDLGTTRSAVAVMDGGDPTLVMNTNGNRITPSIVVYKEGDDEPLVGEQAQSRIGIKNDTTVREIKRQMGEEDFTVHAGGKDRTPAEISAEILKQLVTDAKEVYDEIETVVITVPAYFTADQKRATRQAATIAGLDDEDVELLREPTAAALAYGHKDSKDETVLVYDFGGGTLDISVMRIDDNNFSMLSTSGDTELGGVNYTEALSDLLADEYEEKHGVDIRTDDEAYASLWEAAETAKKSLSAHEKTTVNAPWMGAVDGDIVGIEERVVTREEFEAAVADLLDRAIDPLDEALDKANLGTDDIDNVLLVGGSSKIPEIQDRIEAYFGFAPDLTNDLDRIVAYGAAIMADLDEDITTWYPCPACEERSEGVTILIRHIVEEHGTDSCPFEDCTTEPGGEMELKTHLAGEHGGVIGSGRDGDGGTKIELNNIVARSYGTNVEGGKMHIIVENGTELPASESAVFTTVQDNQTKVPVHVYQGEDEDDLEANEQLHSWHIEGIPEMPAREPNIEVTFDIDDEGILEVTAEELKSGTKATTTIDTDGSLDPEGEAGKEETDGDDD